MRRIVSHIPAPIGRHGSRRLVARFTRRFASLALCTYAGVASAQSPAQSPAQSSGNWAGEWTLAFSAVSRSGDGAPRSDAKPTPWLTFTAFVVQVDSTLGGAMRSDGPTGQFGCRLRAGSCAAGRMRLSWDQQDWQVFEFTLDSGSSTAGTGRAEIRFPDGGVDRYTFMISRR